MEKIKISVILPSLNVVKYIRQCLESILNQPYKNIELICVDAGSIDGTLEVIEQYSNNDFRIKVIKCNKKSYGKQVNMAIDLSTGQYISIVDTDDYIPLGIYNKMINYAEKYDLDYIKGDYIERYEFEDGNSYERRCAITPKIELLNKVVNSNQCPEMHSWDGHLWTGLYRKEFLVKNNIRLNESDGAAFQDVGFFHQVTYYANKVMFIDDVSYVYRIGRIGNSISSPNGVRYMYQEYKKIYEDNFVTKDKKEQWHWLIIKMIYSLLAECEKKPIYTIINDENIEKYIKWFEEKIRSEIEKLTISFSDFGCMYWNKFNLLLECRKKFVYYQQRKDDNIEELLRICRNHIATDMYNARIAILGSGIRGKCVKELLMTNGIKVSVFLDNDTQKQQNFIDGIQVMSVDSEALNNTLYIISVKGCEKELERQLIKSKISKEKIIVPDIFYI